MTVNISSMLLLIEKVFRARSEVPARRYANDVILASFPKSGNTWFRFISSNITFECHDGLLSADFHNIKKYAPEVRGDRFLKDAVRYDDVPLFIKTHFYYVAGFSEYEKLLIIRNPADALISYYHYLTEEKGKKFKSISSFIRHWRYGAKAWAFYHSGWLGRADMVISYEDLLNNPVEEVAKIYRMLGYSIPLSVLSEAVEKSSKKRMRNTLVEKGDPCSSNKDFMFVRKGVEGEGGRVLSELDLEYINKVCMPVYSKICVK